MVGEAHESAHWQTVALPKENNHGAANSQFRTQVTKVSMSGFISTSVKEEPRSG